MKNALKKNFFHISVCLIFLLGIFLRFKTYFYCKPLWGDEAALALNVMDGSFLDFLKPLNYVQCAPFLFLSFTKILTGIFGTSEYVFRLIPFVSGILSIFAFYFLSKQFLNKKWSILAANYLFCVNYNMIYYSEEFKQYSVEVLVTILSLLYLTKLDTGSLNTKKCLIIGLIFSVLFLFSIPVIFILITFIIYIAYKNQKKSIKQIFFILTPFVLLFIPYYISFLLPSKNIMQMYYWDEKNIYLNFQNFGYITKEFMLYLYRINISPLIAIVLTVFGALITLIKKKSETDILFLTLISVAIISSFLHIYILYNRLGLYLYPVLLLLIVKPLDILKLNKKLNILISLVIVFIFGFYFRMNGIKHIQKFYNREIFYETKVNDIVNFLHKKIKDDDIFIIGNYTAIEYYCRRLNLDLKHKILLKYSGTENDIKFLDKLAPDKAYWFLNSGRPYATLDRVPYKWAESGMGKITQEFRSSIKNKPDIIDYAIQINKLK